MTGTRKEENVKMEEKEHKDLISFGYSIDPGDLCQPLNNRRDLGSLLANSI